MRPGAQDWLRPGVPVRYRGRQFTIVNVYWPARRVELVDDESNKFTVRIDQVSPV